MFINLQMPAESLLAS